MPNNPSGNPAWAREPPERRKTDLTHITFDSIRRRRTTDTVKIQEKPEKGPFQEHYACYEGLTWETLRGYLEGKWPGIRLAERKVWIVFGIDLRRLTVKSRSWTSGCLRYQSA
jgi:hypothetical protein